MSRAGARITSEDEQRESLLAACKAGDKSAWQRFFNQRAGQVYRWAVMLGSTPASAEDVAQEVLATAARKIHTCRSEHVVVSWLYQITRRVVANRMRLAWFRRVVRLGRDELQPAFEGIPAETELAVRRCLERLPRDRAELLLLAYVEGFTKDEIAETLGIPPGTVATRLRAAKTRFRELWEEGDTQAHVPSLLRE